MAASVDTPSPAHLNQDSTTTFLASSSPLPSPASDGRFWSALSSRVDQILDDRHRTTQTQLDVGATQNNAGAYGRRKRLKEDSKLLLRGFDSIAQSLSQLSSNLDNALQDARDLDKPPTLSDTLHSSLKNIEPKQEDSEEAKKGLKRKVDLAESSDDKSEDSLKEDKQIPKQKKMMKKAKNLAISMATKAASLARELKSIKSDLCFVQEQCAWIEEENRRLRHGMAEGVRPEEDDLVRLQLEALLAEKSRLANENANLVRENQCLHQLVEYHQMTSHDLSASYEQAIRGMCLDFSSPTEEDLSDEGESETGKQSGADKSCIYTCQALLAEKSRLANENANLVRENQCLHQLVEYHQMTSHDLSASYEQAIRGMCLDFSSPTEEDLSDEGESETGKQSGADKSCIYTCLDKCFDEEQLV